MATPNPITAGDLIDLDWWNAVDQLMGRDITNGASGWVPSPNSWVYVSANSFKVVGVDVTDRYPVGTKLSCTDGGSTKYFYVVSSAFVTDTTVTITGGSGYTLSGGTISDPRYSYMACAEDFPAGFAHTPAYVGWAATPTIDCDFTIQGRLLTYNYNISGTSNATSATLTLPVAAAISVCGALSYAQNNGAFVNAGCMAIASAGSLVLWNNGSPTGWTNANAKAAAGQIVIPI